MKKHCKFSEEKFEKSLWSVSKLVCWTLSLLLGVLLFATVPWAVAIVGLLGISFFIDMKIEENDEEDGTSMQSNGEGCGRCKQDGQIRFCSHKCPFASPPEGEEDT